MKTTFVAVLVLLAAACGRQADVTNKPEVPASNPPPGPKKKLFLDVHNVGPGKVTAQAVAEAHQKDLATQGKYGVDYRTYFLDEKAGKIYCLVEAPDADAAVMVHKEAHGLVPDSIEEVSEGR